MLCPVCKIHLEFVELTDDLKAHHCKQCDGHWLPSFNYWKWLNAQEKLQPETESGLVLETSDNRKPLFCPECKQLLSRFKVGHGTNFLIERCGACAGIWFDRNEWASLKARNLHDDIHFIFSQPWQHAVREESRQKVITRRMEEILGPDKYKEVMHFRSWLKSDKHKSEILAYLRES